MEIIELDKKINVLVSTFYLKGQNLIEFDNILRELYKLGQFVNSNKSEIKSSSNYDIILDIVFRWNTFLTFHGQKPLVTDFPKAREIFRPNRRKKVMGVVSSNKMDKTATIIVTRLYKHPIYKKIIKKSKKIKIHDPFNSCNIGDLVIAQECRKLSKDKHFRLISLEKREVALLNEAV